MSSCCRTPRHKRLVNTLYPDDPQNGDPVGGDLEKLLYFSRSEPDRLDDVGGYLVFKLRRSLARERRGLVDYHTPTAGFHVDVGLLITYTSVNIGVVLPLSLLQTCFCLFEDHGEVTDGVIYRTSSATGREFPGDVA